MKITHIITGLAADGAENALYHLLAALDRQEYQNDVISLTDRGPTAARIEALGVPVRALGMMRGVPNPLAIRRIAKILRRSRPQIVHTWMYHSNLLGGLAAQAAGGIPVIWGIHHSRVDAQDTKRITVWTVRACAWFSKQLPARIICCANSSESAHVQLGYDAKKMQVIYNGIDTELFRPNPEARVALRSRLGLPADALLIGMAGRLHRHKDHRTFLAAARLLREKFPDVHFVLCGEGLTPDNPKLARRNRRGPRGALPSYGRAAGDAGVLRGSGHRRKLVSERSLSSGRRRGHGLRCSLRGDRGGRLSRNGERDGQDRAAAAARANGFCLGRADRRGSRSPRGFGSAPRASEWSPASA